MKSKLLLLFLFFAIFIFPSNKPKLLWFDATANFERLSYPDSIKYFLDKAKETGFTDVVVDVKPITGEVLFKTDIAPMMKEWNGFKRPQNFDFLQIFITEAHKRNLKIYASINIFSGGHNYFDRGIVYEDKPQWQTVNYTDSGLVPITKLKHKYSAMLNPNLKEIQNYELSVLKDLIQKYPKINGVILDRVRYDGIEADFSESSKNLFEKYLGKPVDNFPQDIYEWKKNSSGKSYREEGKYYKKWLEWRVSVIYNFFKDARKVIKDINPKIEFGDYVGAWYPVYYEVGVNWASKNYDPSKQYKWATPEYKNYGYAELLDVLSTGNYFYEVTKEEVKKLNEENIRRNEAGMGKGKEYWYSVEGSAEIADSVVMNAVPIIGGLYVQQYMDHPDQFKKAIKMVEKKTNSLMVFDIVQVIKYDWWDILKDALKE